MPTTPSATPKPFVSIQIETVSVICPHCMEAISEPDSGSLIWTIDNLAHAPAELTCGTCGKVSRRASVRKSGIRSALSAAKEGAR